MIEILLEELRKISLDRPPGYYKHVVSRGRIEGDALVLEESVYRELCTKYSPKRSLCFDQKAANSARAIGRTNQQGSFKPMPADQWPLWAKALKLLAKPEDKGIGDVIARAIGDENSATFKAWHKKIFGKDCGCIGRQADLNRRFPFATD